MEESIFKSSLDLLRDLTINNPIFIFVVITIIWFLPGIVVRRIAANKSKEAKKKAQEEAISKLYPKENKN